MSQILGHVGKWELAWKSAPHGATGESEVITTAPDGSKQTIKVYWKRDSHGIWIQFPHGLFGFDVDGQANDEGKISYRMSQRSSDREWVNLHYLRPGEDMATGVGAGVKKGFRVRAQMPGKIIRILIAEGAVVEKDQPLAVMEAMKMENEIRSPHAGKLRAIAVSQGQAVETGADLFILDPA